MNKLVVVAGLAAVIVLLSACSSKGSSTNGLATSAVPTNGTPASSSEANGSATASTLPLPDLKTPDTAYVPLDNGIQLAYYYFAVSGKPIDYKFIASHISAKYQSETDEFAERSELSALKPQIDASVATAKSHRYIYSDLNCELGQYDFSNKTFGIGCGILGSNDFLSADTNGANQYVLTTDGYNPAYKMLFVNRSPFSNIKIVDENQAKAIEAVVSKNLYEPNFKVRVYAYVVSSGPSALEETPHANGDIAAVITKLTVATNAGQPLMQKSATREVVATDISRIGSVRSMLTAFCALPEAQQRFAGRPNYDLALCGSPGQAPSVDSDLVDVPTYYDLSQTLCARTHTHCGPMKELADDLCTLSKQLKAKNPSNHIFCQPVSYFTSADQMKEDNVAQGMPFLCKNGVQKYCEAQIYLPW